MYLSIIKSISFCYLCLKIYQYQHIFFIKQKHNYPYYNSSTGLWLMPTEIKMYMVVDPKGPRTARAVTFLANSLKSTGFQTCILHVDECGNVFTLVPCTCSTQNYQVYLELRTVWVHYPQEPTTCNQETNHCVSFTWVPWV